ncbi:MAG: DsrE family protein [Dehalococcoidales bacterium]
MKILLILNKTPYDGTDVTWNALRLAEKLAEKGTDLRIFLMNDSIDLAKEGLPVPEGYFNLTEMLAALIAKGIAVKVCGSCIARCGIYKDKPLINGAIQSTMPELAEWVIESDRVISF